MQNKTIPSVFIVDDSEGVRERLRELIETCRDARIIGEAGTVGSAIAGIRAWQPDYVLLDYQLPDGTGLDVLRQVRGESPASCFIVLTNHPSTELHVAFQDAGAQFFLDKSFEFARLPGLIVEPGPTQSRETSRVLFGR